MPPQAHTHTQQQQNTLIDVIVVGPGPLMHPTQVLYSQPLKFQSNPIYGNKKEKEKKKPICCQLITQRNIDF